MNRLETRQVQGNKTEQEEYFSVKQNIINTAQSITDQITEKSTVLSDTEIVKAHKATGILMGLATGGVEHVVAIKAITAATSVIPLSLRTVKISDDIEKTYGKKEFSFGNHGAITLDRHMGQQKVFSEFTIKPGDIIGRISLSKDIGFFKNIRYVRASRLLFRDFLSGMITLADQMNAGSFPKEMVAIVGLSHLASPRLSDKLGFTIENPNFLSKAIAAWEGMTLSLAASDKKEPWLNLLRKKYKRTHLVWMSRQQIVDNQPLFKALLERE